MIVKNNYNECITNLACSISKYFNISYKHNTLSYIDELLEKKQPKNVLTILFDGMGSNLMDNILPKEAFLIEKRLKNITSVFPATTVAATTSIITGLNPVETGMLGWTMYYKDIDKTVVTYLNAVKGDKNKVPLPEIINYRKEHMITKSIVSRINNNGEFTGYTLMPFGSTSYNDLKDMGDKIIELSKTAGKKYIYAYNDEPDSSMHVLGTEDEKIKELFIERNNFVAELAEQLDDTIIFVVADHGHHNIENIILDDYPDIMECLVRTTSLEPRAVNFFVKENKKTIFEDLFNKYFGNDYDLHSKDDVISSKLFGDGEENPAFRDILGDYLAIAKTYKALITKDDMILKSTHAGYTEDEIIVPLVVIDCDEL